MIDLILNILAFIFLMIPYILASLGKWKGDSYKFISFNVMGGIMMAIYFTFCFLVPLFILLNVILSIGGILIMLRKWRKHVQ